MREVEGGGIVGVRKKACLFDCPTQPGHLATRQARGVTLSRRPVLERDAVSRHFVVPSSTPSFVGT